MTGKPHQASLVLVGLLRSSLALSWVSLLAGEGEAVSFLFQDVQHKLKEAAQGVGDEFTNCKLAARAKVVF